MSDRIAAILDQYTPDRYVVQEYANHWVVWDSLNEVTAAAFMTYDGRVRADRRAAQLNG